MAIYGQAQIQWGTGLENVLDLALDAIQTTRVPRPASAYGLAADAVPLSWRDGWDYALRGIARWVPRGGSVTTPEPRTGWSGPVGFEAFRRWALDGRAFRYLPNAAVPDHYVDGCALEVPDTYAPEDEANDSASYRVPIGFTHPTRDLGVAQRGLLFEYVPGGTVGASFVRTSRGAYRSAPGTLFSATGRNAVTGELRDRHYEGVVRTTLLETSRPQLVTDPEIFNNWSLNGTPIRTAGQADPFGGAGAYKLEDDDAAVIEGLIQTVTFTGDAEKCVAIFIKQGTLANNRVDLNDTTAGVLRHQVRVTWTAGVPALATVTGSGRLFSPISFGDGWWLLAFSVVGVVAANTNQMRFFAGDAASDVGHTFFFGANAWNATYPTSYLNQTQAARASDDFRRPIDWPFQDNLTSLVEVARPAYVDNTTSLDQGKFALVLGAVTPRISLFNFSIAAPRAFTARIQDGTNDRTASKTVPAGAVIRLCAQFTGLRSGGTVRVDDGTGFSAPSAAALPLSAFGGLPELVIGSTGVVNEYLDGGLIRAKIAAGLWTLDQMLAK